MSVRSDIAAAFLCLAAGTLAAQQTTSGRDRSAAAENPPPAEVAPGAAPSMLARTQLPTLRANPFSRPSYVLRLDETPSAAALEGPVELELRATMVSGNRALININGTLLGTGDEYEGYRVVAISEGRAVLSNDGERLVLNVYERQLGLDEESKVRLRR